MGKTKKQRVRFQDAPIAEKKTEKQKKLEEEQKNFDREQNEGDYDDDEDHYDDNDEYGGSESSSEPSADEVRKKKKKEKKKKKKGSNGSLQDGPAFFASAFQNILGETVKADPILSRNTGFAGEIKKRKIEETVERKFVESRKALRNQWKKTPDSLENIEGERKLRKVATGKISIVFKNQFFLQNDGFLILSFQ
jgi:hypothetical protein